MSILIKGVSYSLDVLPRLGKIQTKNRTHAENTLVVSRGRECKVGEMSEEVKRYKLSVINVMGM